MIEYLDLELVLEDKELRRNFEKSIEMVGIGKWKIFEEERLFIIRLV